MVSGICLTQVTQLVAQNLTSTTLPRRSCMLKVLPSMVVKATSGAGAAGRQTNQAPMPTATRTARERMSFFIVSLFDGHDLYAVDLAACAGLDGRGLRLGGAAGRLHRGGFGGGAREP